MTTSQQQSGGGVKPAAVTAAEFPIHPLCAVFPDLPPEELDELAESIKRDGQQEPAVVHEGQLLDGKNRQAACKRAGTRFHVTPLPPGTDPVKFVAQRNLMRRHLTSSQRAAIGAEIKSWCAKEAEKRMKAGKAPDPSAGLRQGIKASEQAASLVKVSPRLVEAAEQVKKSSPVLFKRVAAGELTVNAAVKELPKAESTEPAPATGDSKRPFAVVLYDDLKDVSEQQRFYNRSTYPSAALFHLWDQEVFELRRMGWCQYQVLFTVLGAPERTIRVGGVPLCQSTSRFLSASVRGNVPAPVIAPSQVISGGLEGVIKALEEAWPAARKILVSNLKRAPDGWELLNATPEDRR